MPAPDEQPLDPATEAALARLLASARHDDGIPDDVAARLDDVLADLGAERAATAPADRAPAEVPAEPGVPAPVDLAARRRRSRWTTGLLVAAAVVVVAGVGVSVVPRGGGDSGAGSSSVQDEGSAAFTPEGSDDSLGVDEAPGMDGGVGAAPESGPPADAASDLASLQPYAGSVLSTSLPVRPATVDDDVAALVAAAARAPEPAASAACAVAPGTGAVGLLTTYDGADAVVLLDPASGDATVAACDDGATLARVAGD